MMTMMDYSSQYTGSTLSSDTTSESVMSRQSTRVRTVRLVRPHNGTLPPPGLTCRHGPSLGFSVRGGREHGTGFFISHIEPGTEAHRQGLMVGDQIIRVNGFTIDDAVHKEVLQLISNHTHLTLKVRSVGMIPVKDKRTDPLSWQIISDCNSSLRSSPPLTEKIHDVRINISVAPRQKLGCGICKGPDWKPGIFIQFTKDGGTAREAGLRPGDQILYCNNVDFSDIPFNEAVSLMKSSRQLELIVRKSAGSELFPGESSGYNSSASSVTGDQSPSWSESKRLSIVKEESLDLEDRLSHLDRFKNKKWEKIEWDDVPETEEKPYQYKPTIINLSENGTTIKNNGSEECQSFETFNATSKSNKLADICLVSHQHETKTVVVEVHRSDLEERNKNENKLTKSPSISSFTSLASRCSNTSSSLSSAICQEIQRRSEKINDEKPSIDDQLQMRKILKNVDNDKQQQHSKLMDEFRKAHRKMFKSNGDNVSSSKGNAPAAETMDRNSPREFTQKLSERLSSLPQKEAPQTKSTTFNRHSISGPVVNTPPPPPPLPIEETETRNSSTPTLQNQPQQQKTTKPKAPPPPPPIKTSTLSYNQPPPCPTPDYDNLSINSTINLRNSSTHPKKANGVSKANGYKENGHKSSHINDRVEMESLDSFKLNQPLEHNPKPPNTYFLNKSKQALSAQLSNGSVSSSGSTMSKRPVSVTIGEYPSGTNRKLPSKFGFLQNGHDEVDRAPEQSISCQLASELANTLNRSNLRKKTESMENLLNMPQIKPQTNGSVRISVNHNLSRNFTKSTNDLSTLENLSKALANRVTINISPNEKKADTLNGILKNGSANIPSHRSVVHQKSITFGEMPTVINDQSLQVT